MALDERIEEAVLRCIGPGGPLSTASMDFTVLLRGEGSNRIWYRVEVNRIVSKLNTEIITIPNVPELLLVAGAYTRDQILKVMGGGQTFTCQVVYRDSNGKLRPVEPAASQ